MYHNALIVARQTAEMLGQAVAGAWGAESWSNFGHFVRWQAAHLGEDLRA